MGGWRVPVRRGGADPATKRAHPSWERNRDVLFRHTGGAVLPAWASTSPQTFTKVGRCHGGRDGG